MDHGHFCWNELLTWDIDAAKAFYATLYGWTYEASGRDDGYWIAWNNGQPAAGLFQMTPERFAGVPAHWFAYIADQDVDVSLARLVAQGGTVVRESFVVGDMRMAIVRDAGGAFFGLCQKLGDEA